MAKGSRGGKRTAGGKAVSSTVMADLQKDIKDVEVVKPVETISSDYNSFMKMSDDDKADVISNMTSQDVPIHLSNSDFQRFIYNIGLNDKPEVVDDSTFDTLPGNAFYRTVNAVSKYNSPNGLAYSATDIIKQIQYGSITRCSDNGGSVYGRGLYFDNSRRGSFAYGNKRYDIKATAQIAMKFNSNAKMVKYDKIERATNAEIRSGSKLGKALSKCDHASAVSIYAMTKGYNVIQSHINGYHNVLNRNAITLTKTPIQWGRPKNP